MKMKLHDFVRYNRLTSSEVPEEDESTDVCHELKTQLCLNQYDLRFCALVLSLLISVVLNILLILAHLNAKHVDGECPSAFAKLPKNSIPRKIYPHEEYVNTSDLASLSNAWGQLSGDSGVVALSNDYARSMNIPLGLRYPWDETKGVYLLQGYHNLHCLRIIYRSLYEYHVGSPQMNAFEHVLHCLDELRQDVICNADDTPRYATIDPSGTGIGQIRMCRDWDALGIWARKHTACFHHEDGVPDRMVNRFKDCPDGSRPWLNEHQPE